MVLKFFIFAALAVVVLSIDATVHGYGAWEAFVLYYAFLAIGGALLLAAHLLRRGASR